MKQFQEAEPKGSAPQAPAQAPGAPKTGETPKTPEEQQNDELMKQLRGK
jgi:hypothetical protein